MNKKMGMEIATIIPHTDDILKYTHFVFHILLVLSTVK